LKNKSNWEKFKVCLIFISANVIFSIGVSLFLDPAKLSANGLFGLSIILNYYIHWGTGLFTFLLNIPIMILGIWKFKFKFFISTIAAIVLSSAMMQAISYYIKPFTTELLPCALIGGACVGLSIGMLFRIGTSLGGTDIVVKLMKLKYRYLKTGAFYIYINIGILLLNIIFFNDINLAVYAAISIFVQSYVFNFTLYGSEGASMVYIITEKECVISKRINKELHSGVTYLKGTGAYTGNEKRVLLCAMRKQALPQAKEIVLQEDSEAFMIVSNANQVLGKGFTNLDSQEL